jgi:allantoate deiminase
MLGSHYDTVRDAGKWDGPLGVITAIACVADLNRRGMRLPFAIEVVGFADEEGVRFASTLLGSRAVAGTFDESVLNARDADGLTMREAMVQFGLDPEHVGAAARMRRELHAYVELHIEQGPVLEQQDLPIGVVTAIAGATRLAANLTGMAGHAGTVPMATRHDALAGAAEVMTMVEAVAQKGAKASLVATVGEIKVTPGASNVIPGTAEFSLDVRAADDASRSAAAADIRARARQIGARRGLVVGIETVHEKPVAVCAPRLRRAIAASIRSLTGNQPLELMSGAGHDGQAMIHLTDIGMIFVRCRAGISHNPLEHVSAEDMGLAVEALVGAIIEMSKGDP